MTMNDVKDLIDALYIRKNFHVCPECNTRMSDGGEHSEDCRFFNIDKFVEEFADETLKNY